MAGSRPRSSLRAVRSAESPVRKMPPLYSLTGTSPLPPVDDWPARQPPPPIGDLDGPALLTGETWGCQCPDCGAPLAIRAWLGRVDCWSCGAAVALDRLSPIPPKRAPAPSAASSSRTPRPLTPASNPARAAVPPPPPAAAAAPLAQPSRRRTTVVASYDTSGFLSPWLISLIIHLIVLTLLGLLEFPGPPDPAITLSAVVAEPVREGDQEPEFEVPRDAEFDLPVPTVDLSNPQTRRMMVRADQDARRLRVVEADNPYLEPLPKVASKLQSSQRSAMVLSRDPRLRVEIIKQEGGTTLTEAAVARGLHWLQQHQADDGSWSLREFWRDAGCRCSARGSTGNRHVATSLALLPFLGAGQTHLTGYYRDSVARGLRWLIEHQRPDGDLRGSESQVPGMYGHGQAAVVLCEAYLMTGDEALREPAQKAIDFIVEAQYEDGGWRYFPRQKLSRARSSDTSVVGWQLMALQSAVAAELDVPDATFEAASHYLDSVARDGGSLYGYQRGSAPSPPMTAEALLCRVYLGWQKDRPGLRRGLDYLLSNASPRRGAINMYYWYYGTQVFHHYGGSRWNRWNGAVRDRLVAAQERKGHQAGSWAPQGGHDSSGGRLYMTALAICTLEVYYRHLPIFRALDLEPPAAQ